MKSLNWLHRILFWGHIVVSFLLILSSLASYIPPKNGDFLFLFSFLFPAFLGVSVVLGIYWLFKLKWPFLLTVLSIALTIINVQTFFATNLSQPDIGTADFSVLSFNVRLFNQYNWIKSDHVTDSIFMFIEKQSPDVVLFQEFINRDKQNFQFIQRMKNLGYLYYRLEPRGGKAQENRFFGLATFSKFPIKNYGVAFPDNSKLQQTNKAVSIFSDVQINKQIVRVYNTHLQSLKFGNEDYTFVENIGNNEDKQTLEKSKGISTKIIQAAQKRALEVEGISKHTERCPHPFIIAGDFNDPPFSYSYHTLSKNLKDGFIECGFGWGTTFHGIRTIPGLRLDYILFSDELEISSFSIGPKNLSDHRPLFSTFRLPK